MFGNGFMQSFVRSSVCFLVASFALSACSSSEKSCTTELRTAVSVQIESPEGLPISAVTAENMDELACSSFTPTQDAGYVGYDCYEQGPGVYTVRVKSGTMTWSQSVSIAGNDCHVTEHKTLQFVQEASTAD